MSPKDQLDHRVIKGSGGLNFVLNSLRSWFLGVSLCLLAGRFSGQAQIPIIPDWSEDEAAGTGFFDPSRGKFRRDTFLAAANYLGSLFAPAYPREVMRVKVSFIPMPDGTLGSGRPLGYTSSASFTSTSSHYQTNTDYSFALANHLAGFELNAGNLVEATFSTSTRILWSYSTTESPPPGSFEVSLYATMIHELAHGLGFIHGLDGGTGAFASNHRIPTAYDRFLVQGEIAKVPLPGQTDRERLAALSSSDIFWNGALARAANNGRPVKLYAPTPYQTGSSISHLDPGTFGALGLLLLPQDSDLAAKRLTLSPIERAMYFDMGWQPASKDPPRILGLTRNGNLTSISFASQSGMPYRLRYTTSPIIPKSKWETHPTALTGNGATQTFTDTTGDALRFYVVETNP